MEHWARPSEATLQRWREELGRNNGIRGLPIVDAAAGGSAWAGEAARLIRRDGFACVSGVLPPAALAGVAARAAEIVAGVAEVDEFGGVNGARRYSMGGCLATGACLHHAEWAEHVALPAVDAVLTALWGTPDYSCYGADANFALPGSGYQSLHSDFATASKHELTSEGLLSAVLPLDAPERADRQYERQAGGYHDRSGRVGVRALPCPDVCVNIPLTGFDPLNGPPRLICGSHHWTNPIPSLGEEPEWMRLSTPCPLPPGCAVFRDPRTWHGGTPNVSARTRVMLAYLYSAPWWHSPPRVLMPPSVFSGLSARAQTLCRRLVGGDEHGPGGDGGASGGRWGALRAGLGVVAESQHAMSGAAVQAARSVVGGSNSSIHPGSCRLARLSRALCARGASASGANSELHSSEDGPGRAIRKVKVLFAGDSITDGGRARDGGDTVRAALGRLSALSVFL
jgi:ectoine hydroxylase-related dioxygenase (phytanoyl-CoA dioxygenase family)